MAAGQTKLELVLELKNRIKAGLSSARSELNKSIGGIKAKIAELRESSSQMISGIAEQIPGLGSSLGMLANPYAAAAAGVMMLGATYVKAGQMANEWEKGMAKVNVTAQLSKKEMQGVSKEVLAIGAKNTTPLEEVPDAFNKIISAGLDVKTSLAALDPILKGAQAGFTDVGTVAGATVATMNSTGIKDATKVLDVLFATVNMGNAEFADIANYLPKIIPMAEKAGQSFQDTAGAFAYFTAQGFKSEQTATLLENTFKAISDPRITDGFKKIGVNVYDASGRAKPMLAILDELKGKLNGLSNEQKNQVFKTIGVDGEATTALGAMLKDYDKLKEIISFTNSAQGQLNEAIKNAETPTDVWMIVSNELKAVMIQIGQTALPIIKTIGTYILNTIQYFKDLYTNSELFRDIISAIGVYFEYLWNVVTMGAQAAWNIIKGVWGVIMDLKVAIFGAGDGFEKWYMQIKPYILWVWQYVENIASILFKIATFNYKGAIESIKGLANAKSVNQIKNEVMTEYKERKAPKKETSETSKVAPQGGLKTTGGTPTGKPVTGSSDVGKVTGSAQQIKNLTINMDAMVKMGDFVSKHPEMAGKSPRELEQWFMELCARMIRNLETSYS